LPLRLSLFPNPVIDCWLHTQSIHTSLCSGIYTLSSDIKPLFISFNVAVDGYYSRCESRLIQKTHNKTQQTKKWLYFWWWTTNPSAYHSNALLFVHHLCGIVLVLSTGDWLHELIGYDMNSGEGIENNFAENTKHIEYSVYSVSEYSFKPNIDFYVICRWKGLYV